MHKVSSQSRLAPLPSALPDSYLSLSGTKPVYENTVHTVSSISSVLKNPEIRIDVVPLSTRVHTEINVPLPRSVPKIYSFDTEKEVCAKIDAYFDDIIRGYPDATKQLLRDKYYNNEKIRLSRKSLEKGFQANWRVSSTNNTPIFTMLIDSRLSKCPVLFRVNKIHEIAIHIGQAHQRLSQIGQNRFFNDVEWSVFRKFTEQSVALTEKILFDALPENILDRDLLHITHESTRESVKRDCMMRKAMNVRDYMHLAHRSNDNLTPLDHKVFLTNPGIGQFIESKIQLFYNSRKVENLRTNRATPIKQVNGNEFANAIANTLVFLRNQLKEAELEVQRLEKVANSSAERAKTPWEVYARIREEVKAAAEGSIVQKRMFERSLPSNLTSASSLQDAIVSMRTVQQSDLAQTNFAEYSKQVDAFQEYLHTTIGRRLPIASYILKDYNGPKNSDHRLN